MKKILILSLCAGALALSGCASPRGPVVLTKVGMTQDQFQRDYLTCRQYGMQSATAYGLAGNWFVESWIEQQAVKCMKGLGYYAQ